MGTNDLKDTVKEYANRADERLLKMMKALAENYLLDEQGTTLSEAQYEITDKRRVAYLKGESKSFTWDQVKENARNGISK